MRKLHTGLLILVIFTFDLSTLFAQDNLNLLHTLDMGLPPSGLNVNRVGSYISVLGDINGDGFDDWATRGGVEYESGEGFGSVHIYLGKAERRESETPADMVLYGNENMSMGFGAWKAGDVNGDGFDDMIIYGSWLNEASGQMEPTHALYLGGDPLDTEADVLFRKKETHGGTANYSSAAGDVNNDGYDDILLSIPTTVGSVDTGHVYLFYGGEDMDNDPDVILSGIVHPPGLAGGASNFGRANSPGDVNNDGFNDILVSANEGARLYFGAENMDTNMDLLISDFKGAGTGTGPRVGAAGDVNNDGYDDMLITANIANCIAFVFYGGSTVDAEADVIIPTWAEETSYGFSSSPAGDMNKDGFDDIILGTSTYWSLEHAQVNIFYGGTEMDSIADVSIDGPVDWHLFGFSVAGNGDFDGDGYPDFLIGNIGNAATLDKHDEAGNISLFYGGETISDSADAVFSGIADSEGFGTSVAYADVNNDGYEDIIVGAASHWEGPYHYAGRAYLFYGGESWDTEPDLIFNTTFVYNGYQGHFGKKVRSAGDINGDGFEDIFIEEIFKVLIFLGGAPMDSIPDFSFRTPQYNYHFSAVGDVNNDGFDDVLYSDPANGVGGLAALYYGGLNLKDGIDVTILGKNTGDNLGLNSSGAGDLNGDGFDDFIISASGDDSNGENAGAVYVFFGDTALSSEPDLILTGEYAGQGFGGGKLTGGKDINNDGFSDIVISHWSYSRSESSYEGRIYIYYGGSPMDSLVDVVITGKEAGSKLGRKHLMLMPDLNNDGYHELLTTEGDYTKGEEKSVIFHGGAPMDSIPDIILPHSSINNDFSNYVNHQDNSVRLLVGDPTNSAAGPSMGRVFEYSNRNPVFINNGQTFQNPDGYILYQNYPNPFNPETIIRYKLPSISKVDLSIYNLLGQKVATLVSGKQAAGSYQINWNADGLASGLYFCRLISDDRMQVHKMILVR